MPFIGKIAKNLLIKKKLPAAGLKEEFESVEVNRARLALIHTKTRARQRAPRYVTGKHAMLPESAGGAPTSRRRAQHWLDLSVIRFCWEAHAFDSARTRRVPRAVPRLSLARIQAAARGRFAAHASGSARCLLDFATVVARTRRVVACTLCAASSGPTRIVRHPAAWPAAMSFGESPTRNDARKLMCQCRAAESSKPGNGLRHAHRSASRCGQT